MKQNSIDVFNYVKDHADQNVTANDIAEELGLSPRSVNAIITSVFTRHKDEDKNIIPLMERVQAEILDSDTGLHKPVKFIKLTDEGRAFEPALDNN